MGFPALNLIGRLVAGATFSLAGLSPRAARMVACNVLNQSLVTWSLASSGSLPPQSPGRRGLTAAGQCQSWKPPGQWSRPPRGLTLGVRPNSPQHKTTVRSSNCRRNRSRNSAANAGSSILTASRHLIGSHEVVGVGIPAIESHLDAAYADLDEPASGQAAAAERRIAILGAQAFRFVRHVERLELLGGHHRASTGERLAVQGRHRCADAPRAKARSTTSRSWTRERSRGPTGLGGRHVGQFALLAGRRPGTRQTRPRETRPCSAIGRSGSKYAAECQSGRRAARGGNESPRPIEGCSTVGSGLYPVLIK